MATVIVPVGQGLGPVDLPEAPAEPEFLVHHGRDVMELSREDYLTWLAAHGRQPRQARLAFSRLALEKSASRDPYGVAKPKRAVRTLLRSGLLAEFDVTRPDTVRKFFTSHKLIPTGRGFGVSREDPTRFRIGPGHEPYLDVPSFAYFLWSFSHVAGSMWAGCQSYADREGGSVSVDELARRFAIVVPALVSSFSAHIDPEVAS